jgi:asparagine synthase (glutamine-hydrolysing)
MIAVHAKPAASSRVLLRGDGADPLLDAPLSVLASRLKGGPYRRLMSDFLWLTYKRQQVPRFGIRTTLRGALGFSKPPAVQPFPEWLSPMLQRKFHLRERWVNSNNAEDIRPGFELADSYWPLYFELIDPGTMRLPAENRYPFVDLRLLRYLLRLPPIPWFAEKSLLRIAMNGRLPREVLTRPKTPLAGNPWARLLPPAETGWWKARLVPAAGFEDFVEIESANTVLAKVAAAAQAKNDRNDINLLRSSLRPLSLNLWLQHTRYARLSDSPSVHQETT